MSIIGHVVMGTVAPFAVGAIDAITGKVNETAEKKRKKFIEQHPEEIILWLRSINDHGNHKFSEVLYDKEGNELFAIRLKSTIFIRDVYFYEKDKCYFKIHVGRLHTKIYDNKRAVGSIKKKFGDASIQIGNDQYECKKNIVRINGREIAKIEKGMMFGTPILLKNINELKFVAIGILFPLCDTIFQRTYDELHPYSGE